MTCIKQTCLFLSAQSYKITDENTGEINSGISLWYISDNSLLPCSDELSEKKVGVISRGFKPMKTAIPLDMMGKLGSFPGLYEVSFEMVSVANKAQLRFRDIAPVSSVRLEVLPPSEQPKGDKPKAG
jgi:hypothetical protein